MTRAVAAVSPSLPSHATEERENAGQAYPAAAPAAHYRIPTHYPGQRVGLFGGSFDPPHGAHLSACLLAVLLRWLPDRRFVLVGDAGYGSHEVARCCYRHRQRLTLVSKLHPDARLFGSPPPYAGQGRPRDYPDFMVIV